MIGKTLGHYQVEEKIGQGGMGVVYRAQDSNLHRPVALKLLPDAFASDPERLARFEREARLLASLNHPNIAAIHGLEHSEGICFLVLELVEGPTLADRLKKSRIPVDETLDICRQIAEGLEAAHEKGIIHRDLKPANVKITPEGKVKVLDFGLARAFQEEPVVADLSQSPTITDRMTGTGVILGTAAYMSPEQSKGKAVDKRTDIWAFGCVLYECLTGKPAFAEETLSETLASILRSDPDLGVLPAETPALIRTLLRRCLQKDPRRRLNAIGDARLEIEDALTALSTAEGTLAQSVPAASPVWSRALPWALAGVFGVTALVAALLAWSLSRMVPAPTRSTLVLSPDNSLTIAGGVAISPDGRTVAFTARTSQSYNLYVRRLDDWEPHIVPLTEGAASPFFSPDGRWIAFLRKGLEKIALSGGSPQVICPLGGGGRWGDDNTIIFGRWPQTGLWQVPAAGGEPQAITKLSEGSNVRHMWPEPLPGGRGILFTLLQVGRTSIAVLPPGANQPRILVELGSFPRYLPSGHLVYVADKRLLAVPFDLERLEVSGSASVVINDVDDNPLRPAPYDVSASGTLVFQTAGATASNVVWKDRQGITMSVLAHSNQFEWPALSPDGKRFSVVIRERYSRNIWIGRVVDEPLTRLTFGNDDWYGVWSSDGKRLFYLAGQSGTYNIFWISADGGGKPERLTQSPHPQSGTSLSPNGDILLYDDIDPSTSADIWELSISSRKVRPVVQTEFVEGDARFSPDGHWISYRSDESGKQEVYVQAYPGPGIKKRISLDGGTKAFWSHTGRELFYSTATALFAVPVLDAVDLRLGIPKRLFEFKKAGAYDISPDDQRFLMLEAATEMPVQVNLVQNWFEELKRLVPTGK